MDVGKVTVLACWYDYTANSMQSDLSSGWNYYITGNMSWN